MRVVTGHYRREAKRRGLVDSRCGGVTSIQRAASGLRLNLHYHTLMCDGVFTRASEEAPPQFHAIGVTDEDVASVVATVRRRVMRLLERRGLLGDEDSPPPDPLQESDPLLAACYQASVQGRVATGERAGCGVRREKGKGAPKVQVKNELCANIEGFDLHARTRIARHKRGDLERLCRTILRPPVATDRLRGVDERRTLVALDLKRSWADGTRSFIFTPSELIEKLVPLIPLPMSNSVRYHGVFAPGSSWRAAVVAPLAKVATDDDGEPLPEAEPCIRPRRLPWHRLLMRVIGSDVLTCQKCQGKRTIIAFIQDPVVARDILVHLGLTTPQVQHHRSRRRGVRRSRSSSCSVYSSASSPRRTVNSPAAAR